MIVKNPTDSDVKIQIDGIFYEVGANDELEGVKPEHAARWKGIHQFLSMQEEDMGTTSKEALQETTEEDIEEVTETETEEVVEEEVVEDEKETSSKNKKDK